MVILRINLACARHNIRFVKERVGVPVYAVVKADAYGHGSEFCRYIESEVYGFAVSCAYEAEELRRLKIKKPILIMSPSEVIDRDDIIYTVCAPCDLPRPKQKFPRRGFFAPRKTNCLTGGSPCGFGFSGASSGFLSGVSGSVSCGGLGSCGGGVPGGLSGNCLGNFSGELSKARRRGARVAVKLNTGMNRLGGTESELAAILDGIRRSGLELSEVFTHFSSVESAEEQFERFNEMADSLPGLARIPRHCCASNCLILPPKMHCSAVRCGLALYGYGHEGLLPTLSAYTVIVQINTVKKGARVGYGDYEADRDMKVAVLKAGYADGIRRAGGRCVRINGYLCKIVGKICMDMCMADITDAYAERGDRAYFLDNIINANTIAGMQNTIPYEILTLFSAKRIQRIYE